MQTIQRAQTQSFTELRTYITAALFATANIVFPQLCHLAALGGPTWLPIYFFTLIGSYRYGWRVGLLIALASPTVNSMLFGMPSIHVLPPILLKSILLAFSAALIGQRWHIASLLSVGFAVIVYQTLGSIGEWAMTGSLTTALQDVKIGLPGIFLQIFGGWAILKVWRND